MSEIVNSPFQLLSLPVLRRALACHCGDRMAHIDTSINGKNSSLKGKADKTAAIVVEMELETALTAVTRACDKDVTYYKCRT